MVLTLGDLGDRRFSIPDRFGHLFDRPFSVGALRKPHDVRYFFALFVVPPALVEAWWKQRRRRQDERVLVFPEEQA
jgi:hypothetical protein